MAKRLPFKVIEEDHKLEEQAGRATRSLMELRWHWTLDPSNPNRVGFTQYARDVERGESTIRQHARAHEKFRAAQKDSRSGSRPGAPTSPNDYLQLQNMSERRQKVTEALAVATGKKPGYVASNMRDHVRAVQADAEEQAEANGTTLEYEIPLAAKRHVNGSQAEKPREPKPEPDPAEEARRRRKEAETELMHAMAALARAADLVKGLDPREILAIEVSTWRDCINDSRNYLDVISDWFDGKTVAGEVEEWLRQQ